MVLMNKLRARMVEADISVQELAEKIGMDKSTLYRRISGNGEDFTIHEIDDIKTALQLSSSEATQIFFA